MARLDDGASHAAVEQSTDEDGAPVLSISGELDTSNVDAIGAEIEAALTDAYERLVFDLSALEFVDSSGIALLLRAAQKVGRVELRNPSGVVRRVIAATGLNDVLHVQP